MNESNSKIQGEINLTIYQIVNIALEKKIIQVIFENNIIWVETPVENLGKKNYRRNLEFTQ